MRFEKMNWAEQIRFMKRLHGRLNRGLFGGQLTQPEFSIEYIRLEHDDPDGLFWGGYKKTVWQNGECVIPRCIAIDHTLVEDISGMRTQREQFYLLALILLHEMVHQFCDENGIDDSDHNENYQQAAEDHWLYRIGEDEYSPVLHMISARMRIR